MDRSFTDEQGERFDPERFSELIVAECLSTISAKKIIDAPTEYEQGYNKALKSVHGDIVRKFGFDQ